MMSKAGGKGGPAKNPKKVKWEPDPDDIDDDNFLEDLVTTTETDKGQPSYSTLEPGGFVTKGTDETGQKTHENCGGDRESRRRRNRRNGTREARTGGR